MKKYLTFLVCIVLALPVKAQNKVEIDIKTGSDNLEPKDFMENPSLVLRIKDKADIVINDINHGQIWTNNSQHRVTIPLTGDIPVNYISEIEIFRKDKDGSKNNVEAAAADNWNIDEILVTATYKVDGRTIKYKLLKKSGNPLVRFVYEKGGQQNQYETSSSIRYVMDDNKIISGAPAPVSPNPGLVIAKPIKLVVEITTGDDDLRGGGNNLSFKIFLRNNPTPIQWSNINANKAWDNYSVKRIEKVFNNILSFDEIEKIEMWHDGGGGMGADNWNIDKVSVIAKQEERQKILVDKVGAPLHRFTGDTRRKTFVVE